MSYLPPLVVLFGLSFVCYLVLPANALSTDLFGSYQLSNAPNCLAFFPEHITLTQHDIASFYDSFTGYNRFTTRCDILDPDSLSFVDLSWAVTLLQPYGVPNAYTLSLSSSPLISAKVALEGHPSTPCDIFFSDYLQKGGARVDFICNTAPAICTATYIQSSAVLPIIPQVDLPPPPPNTTSYSPSSAQPSTSCFNLSNYYYSSYEDAVKCLTAIPFNEEWRAATLQHLHSVIPLYSFIDINRNSGPPANINVDLYAELDRVSTSSYENDFAFHSDLTTVFRSTRDAHTQYSPPSCYVFNFLQPYSFDTMLDDDTGEQILLIRGPTNPDPQFRSYYLVNHQIDNQAYAGWIVDEIDGMPALQKTIEVADNLFPVKNRGVRVNQLFASQGLSVRHSSEHPIPSSSSVSYLIHHPITSETVSINAPWVTFYGQHGVTLQGIDDMNLRCSPAVQKKREEKLISPPKLETRIPGEFIEGIWRSHGSSSASHEQRTVTLVEYTDTFQLQELDTKTGIIVIPTFQFQNDFTPIYEFHLLYSLAIHRYGYSRLMFDLTSNGGGSVFLGAVLSAYLSPDIAKDIKALNNYDQIHAPLWDDLVPRWFAMNITEQNQYPLQGFFLQHYLASNPTLSLSSVGISWYTPPIKHQRGGRTSPYSQLYDHTSAINAQTWIDQMLPVLIGYIPFPSDDLMMVTDGACGSTCSIFIRSLQFHHRAKIIGFGGVIGESLDSNSFAGGTILRAEDFSAPLFQFGVPSNLIPTYAGLQQGAGLSQFTLMEAYGPQSPGDRPAEFVSAPVDARMNVWSTSSDTEEIYYQASVYFDCCFTWEVGCLAPACSPSTLIQMHGILFVFCLILTLFLL